jgi:hypothetical protein
MFPGLDDATTQQHTMRNNSSTTSNKHSKMHIWGLNSCLYYTSDGAFLWRYVLCVSCEQRSFMQLKKGQRERYVPRMLPCGMLHPPPRALETHMTSSPCGIATCCHTIHYVGASCEQRLFMQLKKGRKERYVHRMLLCGGDAAPTSPCAVETHHDILPLRHCHMLSHNSYQQSHPQCWACSSRAVGVSC